LAPLQLSITANSITLVFNLRISDARSAPELLKCYVW